MPSIIRAGSKTLSLIILFMLTEFQFETTHFNTEHSAKVPPSHPLHPTQFNAFSVVECVPKARTTCTIWREFSVSTECGRGQKLDFYSWIWKTPKTHHSTTTTTTPRYRKTVLISQHKHQLIAFEWMLERTFCPLKSVIKFELNYEDELE